MAARKSPVLGPAEEFAFRQWYAKISRDLNLDPNPDDPRHYYDWRGAFKSGAKPTFDFSDGRWHWPSEFKSPKHPNRYVNEGGVTFDTIGGQPVSSSVANRGFGRGLN